MKLMMRSSAGLKEICVRDCSAVTEIACAPARRKTMAELYLIGVDGGTESLRAGIFDLQGRPQAW